VSGGPGPVSTPMSRPQLQYTQEHGAVGLSHPALGLHARERIEACALAIRARFDKPIDCAIILGTGLGGLADEIEVEQVIEYGELPNFPLSTVETHKGRLLCGTLAGKTVVAMQGRFHRYEGYSLQQVTFPVRVLRALGAGTLIVSNACGGMHPLWAPGDLMLIADHINLLGDNPLIGPNDDTLGPRFPDMSEPYDAALRAVAREVATEAGITLREGVYVAVQGPNLETRAEYRFLRALGADVVVEIQPELLRLAAPLARPGIRLVQRGNPLPHFDVHCPLLSIPGALACELDTIPPPGDELAPDAGLVRAWKERLGQGGELRVGLVWAGNPQHGNDHHRSFRPLAFGPLLEVPGVRFFSMQKNRREGDDADLARLGRIEDIAPLLTDFAESAAALCALDLLVAADTSIVHLAGAIRRPVWTMVPFSPDWRWMLGRDDTPWYPSMRLFRQPRQRDWKSVFARVAAELALLRR